MCVSMSVHVTAGVCVPMCDCRRMDVALGVEVREQLSGDDSLSTKGIGN